MTTANINNLAQIQVLQAKKCNAIWCVLTGFCVSGQNFGQPNLKLDYPGYGGD